MKFAAATTLLFATLALAGPAPAAQPAAAAVPALAPAPEPVEARDAILITRDPKKSKPKSSSGNSTNNAVGMLAPSRALELGVLGLGVLEVVRLWG